MDKNSSQNTEAQKDIENVKLVLSGDKEAYILIVRSYEEKLSRYIKRFINNDDDVIDILQNTFIKAYQNLNSYDPSYRFNSWIYRIAHNESINYLKKHKKLGITFIDMDILAPTLFAKETADNDVLVKERQEEVETALTLIKPKYREVLVLSFFEEMNYEEISDILHIPISTVGTRIRRGKQEVRKVLEKSKTSQS